MIQPTKPDEYLNYHSQEAEYVIKLKSSLETYFYNVLNIRTRNRVNVIPGMSLKSSCSYDPFLTLFVDSFVSGFDKYIFETMDHTPDNDEAVNILDQIGLNKKEWYDPKDHFRCKLYQAAYKVIVGKYAPGSEVRYAIDEVVNKIKRQIMEGNISFETIHNLVKTKLSGKNILNEVFWGQCLEAGIMVSKKDYNEKVIMSDDYYRSKNIGGLTMIIKTYGPVWINEFNEKLNNVTYSQDYGIQEKDLTHLIEGIKKLQQKEKDEFVKLLHEMDAKDDENHKTAMCDEIKSFLIKHSVPVAQSMTASVILNVITRIFS